MRLADALRYSSQSLLRYRFRSAMLLLSMTLGVASVLVLTALGEGARSFVLGEFSFLGKDVLIVLPGKKQTTGGLPPIMGTAARDLLLEDVQRLQRSVSAIRQVAPLVVGSAEVSYQSRAREVVILGTTPDFIAVRQLQLAQGRNLALDSIRHAAAQCLIGQTLKQALFEYGAVLGQWLRVGDYRCRVVGVLQGRGDAMGMDLSDALIVPVASAQMLFNTPGLFRLLLKVDTAVALETTKARVIETMTALHQGQEDITVISPDALLASFDQVLLALTLAVGAIAAISLLVSGVLVMNVTMINVSQRIEEIGLLKALGASRADVQRLFVLEAWITALLGAAMGSALGFALVQLGAQLYPDIPFRIPLWALLAALTVALVCAVGFAWLPARRASAMAPVKALQHV